MITNNKNHNWPSISFSVHGVNMPIAHLDIFLTVKWLDGKWIKSIYGWIERTNFRHDIVRMTILTKSARFDNEQIIFAQRKFVPYFRLRNLKLWLK